MEHLKQQAIGMHNEGYYGDGYLDISRDEGYLGNPCFDFNGG